MRFFNKIIETKRILPNQLLFETRLASIRLSVAFEPAQPALRFNKEMGKLSAHHS